MLVVFIVHVLTYWLHFAGLDSVLSEKHSSPDKEI